MIEFCIGFGAGLCAGLAFRFVSRAKPPSTNCAHEYCGSRIDPRCAAQNCTQHCARLCRCIDVWKKSDQALQLAQQGMEKARR